MVSNQTLSPSAGVRCNGSAVTALAYSPDGERLLSGDSTHDFLMDAALNPIYQIPVEISDAPLGPMRSVDFAPDGSCWYSATAQSVNRYRMSDGARDWSNHPKNYTGAFHDAPMRVAASPDGRLAVCHESGRTMVWGFDDRPPARVPGEMGGHFVAWLDRDRLVAADGYDVNLFEPEVGASIQRWHIDSRVLGMDMEPNRQFVALRTLHEIELMDMTSGQIMNRIAVGVGLPIVKFRPGTKHIAFPYLGGVGMYLSNGDCVHRLPIEDARPTSLAFSADGNRLAVGCSDGAVQVFNLPYVA